MIFAGVIRQVVMPKPPVDFLSLSEIIDEA